MNLSKSHKLWNRAKCLIPGGTQLLSKRPEMFLPNQWPSYYGKAKGIEVWDLDDNTFLDMSIMGIGACILGYADDNVDKAVIEAINDGSMNTLNCPEDVELAELLLKLHSWAGMIRYARTGGEAMAVAVRIARAYSKREKIAFCGYHGWHDWYLSANLANKQNLDGHLLPGLDPLGVPRGLKGTAIPFNYNRIEELEEIVKKNDIGTIVIEPVRHREPEHNFLFKAREIADEINAVLVFDEITSGFRLTVGGAHLIYKINPDIAVFGKAMSNGYPMGAIIGKREIMDVVQETFISSTYWTERIGPVASIATIKKMINEDVPAHLCKIGNKIKSGWTVLAKKNDLKITVGGIPPLPLFVFNYKDKRVLHTLFVQEMLEKGFLTSSKGIYVSYSHNENNVEKYLENVDTVFNKLKKTIENKEIYSSLKGPMANEGFKRLT